MLKPLCTAGAAVLAVAAVTGATQQGPPTDVPCSQIAAHGIYKQANLRAALIRIRCGVEAPGKPQPAGFAPLVAPSNVDVVTGGETYPHVTQSESSVWTSDGTTIVVNYNDSSTAPNNYSGVSVSTDGGATFVRQLPAPFASGHGTNVGDPILVYNANLALWFAGDLVTGCGGQGIGLWTSTNGLGWSVGACAHNGADDDRESMWVDNNASSPFYGRMYISWNDFAIGEGLYVTHSDDGATWSAPVAVNPGFIRNVQITGAQDGAVFIAAMDEGGGGFNNRTNVMYRSTNGGSSFTGITMGAPFAPPGDLSCGYFAAISPIWRHMGWGQPAAETAGSVHYVHYAYAGAGVAGDAGDIYYTRSSDNGATWSAPIVLNTDRGSGTQTQWMPSLSVTPNGNVHVYWHDRRNTTDGQNYEVWGIQSNDHGATWFPDEPVSSALIDQPEQPDPSVVGCYAGDYNYATAFNNMHFATWADGRAVVSGHHQQDVMFAIVLASGAPPPPTGDFSVSCKPSNIVVKQGDSKAVTCSVKSLSGFTSSVALSCAGQAVGVTCSFSPASVSPPNGGTATSILTVTVGISGSSTFNVVGTSGPLVHSSQVTAKGH